MLLYEFESAILVEMSGRVKALKRPQVDALIVTPSAEVDRNVDEPIAGTASTQGIGHDEPPQMGSLTSGVKPVDRNGALNASV